MAAKRGGLVGGQCGGPVRTALLVGVGTAPAPPELTRYWVLCAGLLEASHGRPWLGLGAPPKGHTVLRSRLVSAGRESVSRCRLEKGE